MKWELNVPGTIIAECIEMVQAEFKSKETNLEFYNNVHNSMIIRHHPTELRLMFLELIQNAYEAVLENDAENRKINVTINGVGNYKIEVIIEDAGKKIDKNVKSSMFSPFFSTKDILSGGGSAESRGMGLAIAKRIAHVHGGKISVRESDLGGIAMCVALPAIPKEEAVVNHIMVVDDDPMMLNIYNRTLRRKAYALHMFNNAKDALESLQQQEHEIELIVLDEMMPGMTGVEMLEELSKMNIKIPVIMITGAKDNELARKVLDYGVTEVIDKPVNNDKLEFLISRKLNTLKSEHSCITKTSDVVPSEYILLVDNDSVTNELISMALEKVGYVVKSAEICKDAVKYSEENYFDLILLDANICGDDMMADAVIQKLKRNNPYTPVIAMTSTSTGIAYKQAMSSGASHALQKPHDLKAFVDEIKDILSVYRLNAVT
jgi:DNA-binding response OmpR family regulator/anti-sigma regulatory factor (Ser/Thr protein kinase)